MRGHYCKCALDKWGRTFLCLISIKRKDNKMNKRILAGVLAAIMTVSLTACSDSKESGGTSTPVNINSTKNNAASSAISEIMSALDDNGTTSTPEESTTTEPSTPTYTDDPSIVYSPAEDFEYWYDEAAGGTMIRGYTGEGGEVAIPKEIDGKPVTIIDANAFKDNTTITSIYIPSTIKKIDKSAFEKCAALETVTLVNGLETIGQNAFNACEKLKSVEIPDTVTALEGRTDGNTLVTYNQLVYGYGIFGMCTSLETVTIGKGVTAIPSYCFLYCTSLKSITIPGNAKTIGNQAFSNCTNLETVVLEEGVEQIGNVKDVFAGSFVFAECSSLVNITLPESLIMITKSAFSDCNSLTDVEVPSECSIIGTRVFSDCPNIKAKFRGKTYTYDQLADLNN